MTIRAIVLSCVALVIMALLFSSASNATSIPTTEDDLSSKSCSPDYFEVLKNHGTLEGQRRIIMASSMIMKPDSVMDYTCFGNFIDAQRSPYFSTSYVLFSEIHGGLCFENSLHCSLTSLVLDTLSEYLSNNFPDTMLGGRGTLTRVRRDPGMCNMMYRVWDEAKCFNFQSGYMNVTGGEDLEGFHSFAELTNLEPRQIPTPCGERISQDLINATFPAPIGTSSFYDNLQAAAATITAQINAMTRPYTQAGDCFAPIMTGFDVTGNGFLMFTTNWPDGVCPNPGCVLRPSATCQPIAF